MTKCIPLQVSFLAAQESNSELHMITVNNNEKVIGILELNKVHFFAFLFPFKAT